ncbi:MAG: UDP-N-acetylmuramoyl-tripeptide--D-alanyl-D-alanine ligase [Parvularcula sp.]
MSESSALWDAREIAVATAGDLLGASDWMATGVSIDSRTICEGDLFVALSDKRDGHEFIGAAQAAGASAALVSRLPLDTQFDLPMVKVPNVQKALEQMAAAARDRCFGKFVAVTGSAGKTSTKEMLRQGLSSWGRIHAADRSFNNHIGVPLTLSTMPAKTDLGIFEIGMNHAGEIEPLSQLVQPHVAIITTIASAHLEYLGSLEAIAAAKAEIFAGIRPGGTVILPADNPFYPYLCERAAAASMERIIPFGESDAAEPGVQLKRWVPDPRGFSRIELMVGGQAHQFELASVGRHQALNALAVVGVAHALGMDLEPVLSDLSSFAPGGGRGAVRNATIAGHKVTLLDESYNANPASMAAAISLLGQLAPKGEGRRIAILGEMKELGPTSADLHASLSGPLQEAGVDLVFTAGADMDALREALPTDLLGARADEAGALAQPLMAILRDGDVLLFKGSNASHVGALVSTLLANADEQG